MNKIIFFLMVIILFIQNVFSLETDKTIISLKKFIEQITEKDCYFEEILTDQLYIKHRKNLLMPPDDLIISVKEQLDYFIMDSSKEYTSGLSLKKLFPSSGVEITTEYYTSPSLENGDNSSGFSLMFSQSIANNAFGKSTFYLRNIINLESEILRFQIAEAYEDYLASLITIYYDWVEKYENLKISESSYQQNIKLLDSIKNRQKSKIALDIDVNKVKQQVIEKKEQVISQTNIYQSYYFMVITAMRLDDENTVYIPDTDIISGRSASDFQSEFESFKKNSRTMKILKKLEETNDLKLKRAIDNLLPSVEFYLGYNMEGEKYLIEDYNNTFYSGVKIDWPVDSKYKKAVKETAEIDYQKIKLSSESSFYQLKQKIRSLFFDIETEEKLIKTTMEKISIAEAILKDETENYSFGKVSLNDYIDAVNVLDDSRFSKIYHQIQLKKLLTVKYRIMDQLIQNKKSLIADENEMKVLKFK